MKNLLAIYSQTRNLVYLIQLKILKNINLLTDEKAKIYLRKSSRDYNSNIQFLMIFCYRSFYAINFAVDSIY